MTKRNVASKRLKLAASVARMDAESFNYAMRASRGRRSSRTLAILANLESESWSMARAFEALARLSDTDMDTVLSVENGSASVSPPNREATADDFI